MSSQTLEDLGFRGTLAREIEQLDGACRPGRVTSQHGERNVVTTADGDVWGVVSGRLKRAAASAVELPAVGDWVALEGDGGDGGAASIRAVLERSSVLVRKAAGKRTEPQVIAANVDTVFLVTALDGDLSPRRLERALAQVWASGALPVIVINKADLEGEAELRRAEVELIAGAAPVLLVSALEGRGLEQLQAHTAARTTVALIGMSGVGKSSIINWLCGEERLKTGAIRESDKRGKHTTTHRELVRMPSGGLLIDTPGMRELGMWDDGADSGDGGLGRAFDDVTELAAACRFNDCAHDGEPGCAVATALSDGTLAADRYASYLKLGSELQHQRAKADAQAELNRKRRGKAFSKENRRRIKIKGR